LARRIHAGRPIPSCKLRTVTIIPHSVPRGIVGSSSSCRPVPGLGAPRGVLKDAKKWSLTLLDFKSLIPDSCFAPIRGRAKALVRRRHLDSRVEGSVELLKRISGITRVVTDTSDHSRPGQGLPSHRFTPQGLRVMAGGRFGDGGRERRLRSMRAESRWPRRKAGRLRSSCDPTEYLRPPQISVTQLRPHRVPAPTVRPPQ
jgi:hypothetical protein